MLEIARKYAEELNCDNCGNKFGWVHVNDLNGSYFLCNACMGDRPPVIHHASSVSLTRILTDCGLTVQLGEEKCTMDSKNVTCSDCLKAMSL